MSEQLRIAVKLIGSKDLEYIAEPLTEVATVEKRPYIIFEAQVEPTVIQTIAITVFPHSIPLLKEIGRVVFGKVMERVLRVFSGMPGQRHVFTQDFKIDKEAGTIEGRLSMDSTNVDLMREAIKTGEAQFSKALDLMANDPGPADHYVVYGIEFDELTATFKVRRKDVTTFEYTEYDEESGTWKAPPGD